jgi:hypothetical protein
MANRFVGFPLKCSFLTKSSTVLPILPICIHTHFSVEICDDDEALF